MIKGRLLLVEDDPALIDLLKWHFEREDFDVEHTADGEEALLLAAEIAARHHPARLDDRGHFRDRGLPPAPRARRRPRTCRSSC